MRTTHLIILLAIIVILIGIVVFAPSQDQNADQNDQNAFANAVNYQITGIEPGAGVMINTEKAMEQYGLSEAGWTLQESSSAAMLATIQDAVANNEPFIATVWEPHAAFSVADMRKLDDPNNIYNSPEKTRDFLEQYAPDYADAEVQSDVIATVVYDGFAEDAPAAYAFFENFNVSADTQSDWIYQYSVEENSASSTAAQYIANNRDQIEAWMPADDVALGKTELTLGMPPWPGVTVKSEVVKQILEEMGYSVSVQASDAGVVYTSLANSDIDATLAGWLPSTHADYWDEHKGSLEIAGINVTTTWLGLGVPNYVDERVQSLEDLGNM